MKTTNHYDPPVIDDGEFKQRHWNISTKSTLFVSKGQLLTTDCTLLLTDSTDTGAHCSILTIHCNIPTRAEEIWQKATPSVT